MYGPEILVRTLSKSTREDAEGNRWQYHSRSDHHSKVACWGIVFDLLSTCSLLNRHVAEGRVHFGINHEMRDFVQDRKKNLDLVLCTQSHSETASSSQTLRGMATQWEIELSSEESRRLDSLPELRRATVGAVLMALEAKACMTAHQKALPRLYDELNSSQATVHGATEQAIAAGFAMINVAPRYLSPDRNRNRQPFEPVWNVHKQPRAATLVVDKIKQLPKRARTGDGGYDAFSIVVVNCANDGSAIRLVSTPPAPQPGDIFEYASMIGRLGLIYSTRFKDL